MSGAPFRGDCREAWVCDGCMRRVTRSGIAVWADGEHVLCVPCARM